MSAMASQITGVPIVYSSVCSSADQRKYQNSTSLTFLRITLRWPVNSPHKGPVMQKMFPFDDVIMYIPGHKMTVNGLSPDTLYDFYLAAGNDVGYGKEVKFKVRTPPMTPVVAPKPAPTGKLAVTWSMIGYDTRRHIWWHINVGDLDQINRTSFVYETARNYCIVCPNISVLWMDPTRRHTISWL